MIEKLKSNKKGIVLMIFSSLFACTGQLLWKIGTNMDVIYIFIGFVLYGIGALFMLISYKYGKLSILQPVLAFNFILSLFLGAIVLDEKITLLKIFSVILIVFGVIVIGGSEE